MFNICLCGSQDGYPHRADCPYPLFRYNDTDYRKWRDAQEELADPAGLESAPCAGCGATDHPYRYCGS